MQFLLLVRDRISLRNTYTMCLSHVIVVCGLEIGVFRFIKVYLNASYKFTKMNKRVDWGSLLVCGLF